MNNKVNNEVYQQMGYAWWDENVGEFATIRFFINPVRFGYFSRILSSMADRPSPLHTVLDVGCGGGLLAEEFASAGYKVTGIDPTSGSIEAAKAHAALSGFPISYQTGRGEELSFPDQSFDIVACCDVLEHVDDVAGVVSEIARVLKPGGIFFYDTINRTFVSYIAIIKIMQDWRSTAFSSPNGHVWGKFIKPQELTEILERNGLSNKEMRGIGIAANPISAWLNFHRRVKGEITFKELGRRLQFHEDDDLDTSYMGYAVKE